MCSTLSRHCLPLFQAAEAIAAFSLDSPSKPPAPKRCLVDDKKRSVSPDTLVEESDSEEDEFHVLRTKFVGEVDLPECESSSRAIYVLFNSL